MRLVVVLLLFASVAQASPRCDILFGALASGLAISVAPQASAMSVKNVGRSVKVQSPLFQEISIGTRVVPKGDPLLKSTVEVIVSLKDDDGSDLGKHTCSGVYIADGFVQTAAHCTDLATPSDITVRFFYSGSVVVDERAVKDYRQHNQWDRYEGTEEEIAKLDSLIMVGRYVSNDVAVLKIEGPPPKGFAPAKFLPPEKRTELAEGKPVVAAGVGVNRYLEIDPKTGKMPTVKGVKAGVMRAARDLVVLEDLNGAGIKVRDRKRRANLCLGDSGGPAYVYLNGEYYFWGTLWSVSPECSVKGGAYFLPYFEYSDFLEESMRAMR